MILRRQHVSFILPRHGDCFAPSSLSGWMLYEEIWKALQFCRPCQRLTATYRATEQRCCLPLLHSMPTTDTNRHNERRGAMREVYCYWEERNMSILIFVGRVTAFIMDNLRFGAYFKQIISTLRIVVSSFSMLFWFYRMYKTGLDPSQPTCLLPVKRRMTDRQS